MTMIDLTHVQQRFQALKDLIDAQYLELVALDSAAPPPSVPPQEWVCLPTTVQLFGPVHANGAVSDSATTPKFIGNALSCSMHTLDFDKPMAEIESAYVRVIWVPGSAANFINVVHADNGPQNITTIGQIIGENLNTPRVSGVFITEQIQALQAAGVAKNIGFQIGGNGTSMTLFEVELQINFRIPQVGTQNEPA